MSEKILSSNGKILKTPTGLVKPPTPTEIPVKDVKIGDGSIVDADGNAIIRYADGANGYNGAISGYQNSVFNIKTENGRLYAQGAGDIQFTNRRSGTFVGSQNIDFITKAAMTDGKGASWTDTEKNGAWKRQAIIKTELDSECVPNASYFLEEKDRVIINLPINTNSNLEVGQTITVCWYNGSTPAELSIEGTTLEFTYTPKANTRSEINALWDGTAWSILGMEQKVDLL